MPRLKDDTITVEGALGWAKKTRMTTVNLIGLRGVIYTVGRFFPNLIRRLLQRILITRKKIAPYTFKRSFVWNGDTLRVEDELNAETWNNVVGAALGVDQTPIYVVMSRTFQAAQLQPWQNMTAEVQNLKSGEALKLTRKISDKKPS